MSTKEQLARDAMNTLLGRRPVPDAAAAVAAAFGDELPAVPGMLAVEDMPSSADNALMTIWFLMSSLRWLDCLVLFVEKRVLFPQNWLQLWRVHAQVSHAHFCGQGVVPRTSGAASVDFC